MKDIFRYWLGRRGVKGVHLGSLDLLIENESNREQIEPDVAECLEFLKELHEIADEFTEKDGMGRLVLSCCGIKCIFASLGLCSLVQVAAFGAAKRTGHSFS